MKRLKPSALKMNPRLPGSPQGTFRHPFSSNGFSVNGNMQIYAAFHDTCVSNIRKTYHNAFQRLLAVLIEMDTIHKMNPEERKLAGVVKQKRYYEKNREQVKAKRRERYARSKLEKIVDC